MIEVFILCGTRFLRKKQMLLLRTEKLKYQFIVPPSNMVNKEKSLAKNVKEFYSEIALSREDAVVIKNDVRTIAEKVGFGLD